MDLRNASFCFEAVVMMGEKPESLANWITAHAVSIWETELWRRHTVLADSRGTANDEDGLARVLAASALHPGRIEAKTVVRLAGVQAKCGSANRDRESGGSLERQVRRNLRRRV